MTGFLILHLKEINFLIEKMILFLLLDVFLFSEVELFPQMLNFILIFLFRLVLMISRSKILVIMSKFVVGLFVLQGWFVIGLLFDELFFMMIVIEVEVSDIVVCVL